MIFLCFSSDDRYSIVESVLYHLKNYGINTWYDYHRLILGDSIIKENIENGVRKCKYVIWIISHSFFTCACGQMELEYIKELYNKKQIHIFPILYNIKASELPAEYDWVKDLIYNELNDASGTLPTCNQIVCKILKDEIDCNGYQTLPDCRGFDDYSNCLLNVYFDLDEHNITAKIATLYSLFLYISIHKELKNCVDKYHKIIEYLFKFTRLNLSISFKELIIAEQVVAIMLNEGVRNIGYHNN